MTQIKEKTTGNWVTVAGGQRTWVGTKAALATALANDEIPDGTPVMVTDDYADAKEWKFGAVEFTVPSATSIAAGAEANVEFTDIPLSATITDVVMLGVIEHDWKVGGGLSCYPRYISLEKVGTTLKAVSYFCNPTGSAMSISPRMVVRIAYKEA